MIKLIFFLFLYFLSLTFVFDLSISHLLFKFDFSLVLFFLFSFSFIIEFGLLLLKFIILFAFFLFALFLSFFFFHLFIKFFFDFLLKLFFTHSFKLFLLFEKFCIELDQSSPFIIIVSFNLVDWFWCEWAGLWWAHGWFGDLTFSILWLLSTFLWWCLASFLCFIVSLSNLLFWSLRLWSFWLWLFTLIVLPIFFNSFWNILFQNSQRFLSDFLLTKVVSNNILNDSGDIFIAFWKIFIKLISNHLS